MAGSSGATSYFYIIFWITASCTMVSESSPYIVQYFLILYYAIQILFNKAVLSTLEFPFPMFLVTWHMVLSTVMTQILSRTTNLLPAVGEVSKVIIVHSHIIPILILTLNQKKVNSTIIQTQIFPVALFFAVSLVLSNKAYIYLSVSYIQVSV